MSSKPTAPPTQKQECDGAIATTFPGRIRPRRLRRSAAIRSMVEETRLSADRLVMPHFVLPQDRAEEAIPSMPDISRLGQQDLLCQVESDLRLGIATVLLFGVPADGTKDECGSGADAADSTTARAVRLLKDAFGSDLLVITDVCLCAYTLDGHCGISAAGRVLNDPTLERLARTACAYAEAGADMVAPSDMMDGRVAAIRDALDQGGASDVGILSYAVKYASAYYGPFRDAVDTAAEFGHRKGYQMNPANVREALREAKLDEEEGADILMVKPALPYLDVIRSLRSETTLPLAAYVVSGEYAAVKAAADRGWLDEASVVRENLLAITRAGADVIITYHTRQALEGKWL